MQPRLTSLAVLLALGAFGLAAWATLGRDGDPTATEVRLDAIDARLDRLEAALRRDEASDEPTLVGLDPDRGADDRRDPRGDLSSPEHQVAGDVGPAPSAGTAGAEQQIRELVDEAVERKASQIQRMQEKKPTIAAFSETLALSEAQREIVERGVVQAQHEIRAILDTPAADGTNFLDELVEVMAEGMAHPGEKSGRGMKLFGRLLTEEVPGTSETYAARAERAKDRLRETLRRELTPEQHALYEAWQMDPSEIREVEHSPWKEIERRVIERARVLGAELPDER